MTAEDLSYTGALDYLYGLQKFGVKFGLSKTSDILARFGNPHLGRNFIHIGGTNGKGSTGAFLSAALAEAGYRVGFYTSPHLVRFTERFRINEIEISRDEVVSLVNDIRGAVEPGEPPTFFEFTTAMALLHFSRRRTDLDIMEVGMGGRLDATNVITPLVSVITNISREHTFYLGSRLADITGEKAGIIKESVPVVTGARQPLVRKIIESTCRARNSELVRVGADVGYRFTKNGLCYRGLRRSFRNLSLGLGGAFQPRNAAVALAVLEILERYGFTLAENCVRLGFESALWPGRMQTLSRDPAIILDGAHNPAAMRELAASLRRFPPGKRLFVVMGILDDKDVESMILPVARLADRVWYSSPAYGRAAPAGRLAAAAGEAGKAGVIQPDLKKALDESLAAAGPEDAIVICGSLYTVGEALGHLQPEKWRPETGRSGP